jgi:hypothetical protein
LYVGGDERQVVDDGCGGQDCVAEIQLWQSDSRGFHGYFEGEGCEFEGSGVQCLFEPVPGVFLQA